MEWISVSHQEPFVRASVLIGCFGIHPITKTKMDKVAIGWLDANGQFRIGSPYDYDTEFNVTHWMLLPAPPTLEDV